MPRTARDDAYLQGRAAERQRARNPRTHALRDKIHDRLYGRLRDTSMVVWDPAKRVRLEGYLIALDPDLEATPVVVAEIERALEGM